MPPGGEPPKMGPDGKPIKPEEDKSKTEGKTEAAAVVPRPTAPPQPPDPDELKVRPDANGNVQFQFRNQPWPDLLKWLADVSDVSLDWQELPGDYLNLATQRPYSLVETRDTINRHLLAPALRCSSMKMFCRSPRRPISIQPSFGALRPRN